MILSDTLTNLMAGLNTDRDKLAFGQFGTRILTQAEIDGLYSSDWIAGTIVDAVADDETRTWRKWQANQSQITKLDRAEKALDLRRKVRRARKLARKDGGSLIYLGTGEADPSKPLNIDALAQGGLRYLTVYGRNEVTTGPLDDDSLSPFFGEPTSYEVTGSQQVRVTVHPSRMVRFLGEEAVDRTDVGGWGRSVIQRVYDTVLQAQTAATAVASMTTEAKIDVFGVPNLTANAVDPRWQAQMIARFALAARGKSVNGAIIRDSLEEYEQKTINFAGLPEVVRLYLDLCAGAGRMPISRLFGKAPTGLNSGVGGDAETRAWFDQVQVGRDTELEPTMARLDEAVIRSALGSRPAKIWYEWESLWQLTDTEKADVALKEAQATAIYASGKFLPPTAFRAALHNQLIERGVYPGLEDALAAAGTEAPEALIEKTPPAPKPAPTATE